MKKLNTICCTLIIISMLLSACVSNQEPTAMEPVPEQPAAEENDQPAEESADSEPKILRARVGLDFSSLDPAFHLGLTDFYVAWLVYSGLVQQSPNDTSWNLDLAEWIEVSDDGLEISFKLREGVMWQEGYGEVTTEDVKFSFERMIDPDLGGYYYDDWLLLDHVEIIDKYEGKIIFTAPQVSIFNSTLPLQSGKIICKKYVEEIGLEAYGQDIIGSGPYLFSEWRPSEVIILKRNPEYFGEPGYFDEIHIFPIADDTAAEVALDAGDIDVTGIQLGSVDRYESDPNIEVEVFSSYLYSWISMNVLNPKLADENVREAIRYGIDVPSIVTATYLDKTERVNTLISENVLGHWADAPVYERDVEKARAFLNAAGYETLDLEFAITDSQNTRIWAQIIQQNLAEVGINVTINAMESSSFWAHGADNPESIELRAMTYAALPDPVYFTSFWTCAMVGIYNLQNWCDPDFDALHIEALSAQDPERRAELYVEAQKLLDKANNSIWIANQPIALAWSKDIEPAFAPYGEYQLNYFRGVE